MTFNARNDRSACAVLPIASRTIEVVAREYVVETRACWPAARERAFIASVEAVAADTARMIHDRIELPRNMRKKIGRLLLHADVSAKSGAVSVAIFYFGDGEVDLPLGGALHDGFVPIARYVTWSRPSECVLRRLDNDERPARDA